MTALLKKYRRPLYLVFFALSLSNCSPDPQKENKPVPKEVTPEVYTVEIKGMKFVPEEITVNKGDKVIFVNRDIVAHCVTEEKTKAWTSSILPAGEAYMHIANKSATYFCAIHVVMKGRIIVK